jgi:CHAT domain-containing protein/Tfp pilus assembly protein PilF
MTRCGRRGGAVRVIVVLIASQPGVEVRTAAFSQALSQEAKAALKERDRFRDQTQKNEVAGKLSEAITSAKAMLAIERKVLPAGHDDVTGSLNWLARLHAKLEDFGAARAAGQEALGILRTRYGEVDWKVTNARLALDDVARLAGMTRDQKQKLTDASRLDREVVALYRAGKYGEGLSRARRAVALYKEVLGERHPDYAQSLNNLASLLELQGEYAAARPLLERALAIRKDVLGERHPDYASSLNNLAILLLSQGDSAAARLLYEKALAINKDVLGERHPAFALSLNNLAYLLHSQGDYAAARILFERALAIHKEVLGERHPDYAQSLNNLASLLESQGEYAAARPLYEKALVIKKDVLGERHSDYAMSLNNLASLLQSQGDYAAARPLYEKALAIRKDVLGERHPAYAASLNNLAYLLKSQGDYAAARPLYERALAILKEVLGERHSDYATSLNNLADLLESQGDSAAARPLYEKALAIRKDLLSERHPDYATSLNNLAHLLESQGDYAAARPLYEKVLAIRKDLLGERHPDYAMSLNNLASLLQSQGDSAAARPLYEKALSIRKEVLGERHPDYAVSLENLGALYWAQCDFSRASVLLKQALEIAQANLDLAAAAQSERQQLAMARDVRWSLDSFLSLAPLARVSPGDAYRHVLASKGAAFERQRGLHAHRRRFQSDPGSQAARCFADYERTVTQLATLALATPDPKHTQAWRTKIDGLSVRKDELEAELVRLDAGFRAEQAEARRTPEQLQAILPHGTALVDLLMYCAFQPPAQGKGRFHLERRLVAFVVRSDRPIARIDLGPLAPITWAIDDWQRLLISGKTAPAAGDRARTLRSLIWAPLESHLEGIASVLVSPDGPVGLVPLAALPGKKPGSYLIEELSIAVVPVPRVLDSPATSGAPSQGSAASPERAASLLLAGDINYGGDAGKGGEPAMVRSAAVDSRAGFFSDFPHLDATREEILAVRDSFERRFRKGRADVLRDEDATESAFRREAPGHRYLHLATHGYFAPPELRSALGPGDNKAPRQGIDAPGGAGAAGYHPGLLSGIALAGANRRPTPIGEDDGILTALEVAELDLSGLELAVLSACETGLGEVAGGEGLLGLQRAFQVAGADSVVASLWKIGDDPTRALMARFYENLWSKGQPPAEALRQAQLSMLRGDLGRGSLTRQSDEPKSDRLPPYYWAAFVLSTDRP